MHNSGFALLLRNKIAARFYSKISFYLHRKYSVPKPATDAKPRDVRRNAVENRNKMNLSEKLHLSLKSGNENFSFDNQNLNFSLLDFWRWSVSDILSNATRGILAEFIIAKALNTDVANVRNEWDAFDLLTPEKVKVEVKSSAYLQSWEQPDYSKISFSTRAAKPWDWSIDKRSDIAIRSADVYVFCLLNHKDKATVNPLNLDQWEFYVLATSELNNYSRSQHSITLNSLQKLAKSLKFLEVRNEVLKRFK